LEIQGLGGLRVLMLGADPLNRGLAEDIESGKIRWEVWGLEVQGFGGPAFGGSRTK
jgi:hypothetical protein